MRRLSISLLAFLAGTFTLAQTSNNPTVALMYNNFGCPVGFTASRQAPPQIMSAEDARRTGPVQGLHLTLHRLSTPDISSIEVTVYGTEQEGLYLPVGTPSTHTVSKTFELRRISDDISLSEANVSMSLAGSLSHADLISIRYADGTTWHATPNFQCRAIPSNFLLVGRK